MYAKRTLKACLRAKDQFKKIKPFMCKISVEDVFEVRRNLKNNKAVGLDKVHPEFYKYSGALSEISDIDYCLFHIFKMCIESSSNPKYWRVGVSTQLFKAGDHALSDNYRPITSTSNRKNIH